MVVLPFIGDNTTFSLRLEIALLIPYYLKLSKIEFEWTNFEKEKSKIVAE
ncbi:MAG: hypothetical protein JWQ25_1407 [Daejeonella sp.]|nr:hypothetical protein [Daejeonella sp.]